jgi:uncharacterized repeat protein (TIGR04042 family)
MPEMRFHVRWPDAREESCYSPSTIIREHFTPGESMTVAEFSARAVAALDAASERVRQRFGMGCAQAMVQATEIQRTAATFAADPAATVTITGFEP